ncbi:hypothetical protein SB725_30910, partial [Pseudomonas sp. SIMBA_041]
TITPGNMFFCGQNNYGQLGDGTTNNSSNSISVSNATDFSIVSAGAYHTLAIDNDAFLKATGNNEGGRLGDGTTVNKTSFTSITCPTSGSCN